MQNKYKRNILYLLISGNLLFSCKPSTQVISDGCLIKRKYNKGWWRDKAGNYDTDSLKVGTNSIWIGGLDQNTGLDNHIYANGGHLLLQSQADQFLYQHSPQRNVITNLNSGRMGIGTVSPQTKLHVKWVQCSDCGGPPPVSITDVFVYDITGNLLYSANPNQTTFILLTEKFVEGVYLLTIKANDKYYHKLIIKQE